MQHCKTLCSANEQVSCSRKGKPAIECQSKSTTTQACWPVICPANCGRTLSLPCWKIEVWSPGFPIEAHVSHRQHHSLKQETCIVFVCVAHWARVFCWVLYPYKNGEQSGHLATIKKVRFSDRGAPNNPPLSKPPPRNQPSHLLNNPPQPPKQLPNKMKRERERERNSFWFTRATNRAASPQRLPARDQQQNESLPPPTSAARPSGPGQRQRRGAAQAQQRRGGALPGPQSGRGIRIGCVYVYICTGICIHMYVYIYMRIFATHPFSQNLPKVQVAVY